MKVKELIALLQAQAPESLVVIEVLPGGYDDVNEVAVDHHVAHWGQHEVEEFPAVVLR